jgi:hypothetical protein
MWQKFIKASAQSFFPAFSIITSNSNNSKIFPKNEFDLCGLPQQNLHKLIKMYYTVTNFGILWFSEAVCYSCTT